MLESELHALHRDLRTTAKAYIARLENDLLVCLAVLRSYGPIENVSREMLHQIRDLIDEHPHTVLVITNLNYRDTPALMPSGSGASLRTRRARWSASRSRG